MLYKVILVITLYSLSVFGAAPDDGFRPLFEDPKQWIVLGGRAEFVLENGVLTGTNSSVYVFGGYNSFFTSKQEFGNFILEYDYKITPGTNSGVQIRSHYNWEEGNIGGYQIEIDHGPGSYFSGCIYDELGRGWLYPNLERDEKKRREELNKKLKPRLNLEGWNHVRVEAIGYSIKTWVNGHAVANLIDSLDPGGVIAFQVHATSDPFNNNKVEIKNARIKETDTSN